MAYTTLATGTVPCTIRISTDGHFYYLNLTPVNSSTRGACEIISKEEAEGYCKEYTLEIRYEERAGVEG